MPPAFSDLICSRAALDEVARHVASGESSYRRLPAGQELVVDRASRAAIRDLGGNTFVDPIDAALVAARGAVEEVSA